MNKPTTVYCIIVVLIVIHCVAILFLLTVDVNISETY